MKQNLIITLIFVFVSGFTAFSQVVGGTGSVSNSNGNIYNLNEINSSVEFPFKAQELMRNDQIGMIVVGKGDGTGASAAGANEPMYSMTAFTKAGTIPIKSQGKKVKDYKVGNIGVKIYEDSKPKTGNGCNAYMHVSSNNGQFMLNFIGTNLTCEMARTQYSIFFESAMKDGMKLYKP